MVLERRILRSQRDVAATAYDASGRAVAQEQANTASARSFLDRDTSDSPATWDELEAIALNMLKLQLEE